jgi:site-specific DNA recombinase
LNESRLAVLYCRSSKDRADVSIEVQRRELTELAQARGFVVVAAFTDSVESGKDDDRPGFQRLVEALVDRARTWSAILMLDTGRLGRGDVAYWFEEKDCKPRGVAVLYKSLPPEIDEPERMLMKGVFRGVDHWWSLQSKRKALAGMRANVRNGFRAGGRAPTGYQLEHVATGAMREGAPVLKSRLQLSELAPAIAGYLRDRAAGVPRFRARDRHGLSLPQTTLLSIERNALTYAGHTVWNMLREPGTGGSRYRPRADWEIKRDTHAALISDLEAEAVLARSHTPARAVTRRVKHDYLLAGLLRSPCGRPWHGDERDFYRFGKGRRLQAGRIDRSVVGALAEDLSSERMAAALVDQIRARQAKKPDAKRAAGLRRHMDELDRKIRRLAELATDSAVAEPMLRTIVDLERDRGETAVQLVDLDREAAATKAARSIDADDVRAELKAIAGEITAGADVAGLRDVLLRTLEKVELDPENPAELVLHYRLTLSPAGVELASPQGFERYPGSLERRVKLAA